MRVTSVITRGITVFRVSGKLMPGSGLERLHDGVREQVAAGRVDMIVDLGGVDFIGSVGLGVLCGAVTTVQKHGGRLVLCRLRERVMSIFVITRLHLIFEIYGTRRQALDSFEPARRPAAATVGPRPAEAQIGGTPGQ